jgi:hypothetical protein
MLFSCMRSRSYGSCGPQMGGLMTESSSVKWSIALNVIEQIM